MDMKKMMKQAQKIGDAAAQEDRRHDLRGLAGGWWEATGEMASPSPSTPLPGSPGDAAGHGRRRRERGVARRQRGSLTPA